MATDLSERARELVTMLESCVLKGGPPRSLLSVTDDTDAVAQVGELLARVADLEAKPTGWVFTVNRGAENLIVSITAARLQ